MSRPVAVIATNKETGEKIRFQSEIEAARFVGGTRGGISKACTITRWRYKGFYWRKENEDA